MKFLNCCPSTAMDLGEPETPVIDIGISSAAYIPAKTGDYCVLATSENGKVVYLVNVDENQLVSGPIPVVDFEKLSKEEIISVFEPYSELWEVEV